MGTCEWCGGPLPPKSTKRRMYCTPSHKEMAWRARRLAEVAEFEEMLLHGNPTRTELVEAFVRRPR